MDAWRLHPPGGDKRLIAYGDLNCPFCFVLEDRLARRAIHTEVDWRLVEHDPSLPFNGDFSTPAQLEQLGEEIETLSERAPDVHVALPRFRSNSRRGIEAVAEASLVDPDKADVLRRSLFYALWQEGEDISNVELLQTLARQAGLPILKGTRKAKKLAQRWAAEWRAGGFDRIPVLASSRDATLVGLPTPERLGSFLRSGRLSSANDQVCERQSPVPGLSPDDPTEPRP